MKFNSLEALFHHELKDLYSVENQLVEALPRMVKAATNEKLRTAFQSHFEETKAHVEKLEDIGAMLHESLDGHHCKAMESLIEEGAQLISEDALDSVRDAGLIAAAQRVEHYEIAGYGTVRALAERLGHDAIADKLDEILEEEKEADVNLTEIAQASVNVEAQIESDWRP